MNRMFLTATLLCFAVLTGQGLAQRFDSDELWNLQPPTDTTFRNVFLLPQAGTGLHYADKLECLDGGGCLPFEGGQGSFMGAIIGIDQVISPQLNFIGMLGVHLWDATMTVTDDRARVRMPDGSVSNMVRELTMQAKGMSVGLSAGVQFVADRFRASFTPTLELAIDPQWTQTGRILSPAGIIYPNGTTSTVIVPESPIANAASLRFGAGTTLSYDVAVSDRLTIAPMVTAQFMPSTIRSNSTWYDLRLTGGLTLRLEANDLPDTVERIRIYQKIDTVFARRDGSEPGTVLMAGIPTSTSDTVRLGLLHQITTRIRRTDTLVTFEIGREQRLAEERRKQEEEVKVAKVKEEQAVVEKKREELAQTREKIIAEAKQAEQRKPKAKITVGGKTLVLKPKPAAVQVPVDSDGDGSVDTSATTFLISSATDTMDLANTEVANELSIKLTSERQELTFMVLPSVFFDSGSAVVPNRYRRLSTTAGYRPGANMTEQHDVNLDILNIFAHRVKERSDKIIIRGYADDASEGASCDLARARARNVASYLTDVWNINPSLVTVEVGTQNCSPDRASAGLTPRGRQENRRVEFFSQDSKFFLPVQEPKVLVKPEWDFSRADITMTDEEDPVTGWITTFTQSEKTLKRNVGTGKFTNAAVALDDSVLRSLQPDLPVNVSMKVFFSSGDSTETDLRIPVAQLDKEVKFSSLSLAMFAVRSTELGERDLELLKTFAKRLDPGDRVAVVGYSDDLGNPVSNQQLSFNRAKVVADRLRVLRPDCEITRVEGVGSSRYPIGVTSYETPEQRFMSRTVQIVLEKR